MSNATPAKKLTQSKLKEILSYNPCTGIFTWKEHRGRVSKGEVAGCKEHHGYIVILIDKASYKAHRLAFLYMEGYTPENQVDHIDRDRSNNKWDNLRHVSVQCNVRNSGVKINNKSGVTGVTLDKKGMKWISFIGLNGKTIRIGRFEKFKDAVRSRWEAEKQYNFPGCNTTSSAYEYLKNNELI